MGNTIKNTPTPVTVGASRVVVFYELEYPRPVVRDETNMKRFWMEREGSVKEGEGNSLLFEEVRTACGRSL